MDESVTKLELGILICLVTVVVLSYVVITIRPFKDLLLIELLLLVLIGIEFASLALQIRNSGE